MLDALMSWVAVAFSALAVGFSMATARSRFRQGWHASRARLWEMTIRNPDINLNELMQAATLEDRVQDPWQTSKEMHRRFAGDDH